MRTMRTTSDRRFFYIGLVVLALLIGFPSEGFSQGPKGTTYFKKTVNVPFTLRDGSTKVLKPGEYMLKIQDEGGQPVLTILSTDGDLLLKNRGESDMVPEKDRTFDRGGRFRIMATPDAKNPSERWIVFLYDFVSARGGQFVRYRFRIAEAPAPTN